MIWYRRDLGWFLFWIFGAIFLFTKHVDLILTEGLSVMQYSVTLIKSVQTQAHLSWDSADKSAI